jgi:hypothetical protein
MELIHIETTKLADMQVKVIKFIADKKALPSSLCKRLNLFLVLTVFHTSHLTHTLKNPHDKCTTKPYNHARLEFLISSNFKAIMFSTESSDEGLTKTSCDRQILMLFFLGETQITNTQNS